MTEAAPELDEFRAETRAWLEANCPPEMRAPLRGDGDICWGGKRWEFQSEAQKVWMERMRDKGWTAPMWPTNVGGGALSRPEEKILREEMADLGCRSPLESFGLWMLGPALLQFGNDEQKLEHLTRITRGEIRWCQGYSEPGAGSDLANVQTRAELTEDGEHYIVNGQKIWTSYADKADWIFCLVRTDKDAPKHRGISFLLIDMKSPGVEVHPIQTMDGGHEINSVFFTDVKVPAENMVGEVNKGWTYAKFLLGNERLGAPRVGSSMAKLEELKEIAKSRIVRGKPLWDHPRFRDKFVEAQVELKALEMTVMRVLSGIEAGADQSKPDPATSVIKIKGAQMVQRMTELYVEAAGEQAAPWLDEEGANAQVGPDWTSRAAPNYFNMRKSSIYGGSDQVQKGIISKAILGL